MRKKRENPYLNSYLLLALICCIIVGLSFGYLTYIVTKNMQIQYQQQQAEILVEDWGNQINQLEELALKLSLDNDYQLLYLKRQKYNEKKLLENFEQYRNHSVLTDSLFLFYQDEPDRLFHSHGYLKATEVFLSSLLETEEDRGGLYAALMEAEGSTSFFASGNRIFILCPIRVNGTDGRTTAVFCAVVEKHSLSERFLMVSGGSARNLALYWNEELLYSFGEDDLAGEKNSLKADIEGGLFTVYYLPDNNSMTRRVVLPLQVILLSFYILLGFWLANIFAKRNYLPIKNLSEKYRKLSSEEVLNMNALEEIDYQLENMIQKYTETRMQIAQRQKMFRKQVLQVLISGNCFKDIQSYLNRVQIRLYGPYYFVISIIFVAEEGI